MIVEHKVTLRPFNIEVEHWVNVDTETLLDEMTENERFKLAVEALVRINSKNTISQEYINLTHHSYYTDMIEKLTKMAYAFLQAKEAQDDK